MHQEPDKQLERLIDAELRRLPPVNAPEDLLPRVRAAIVAGPVPWWRQSWLAWPPMARVLALVLLAASVGYLGLAGYEQWPEAKTMGASALKSFGEFAWVWELARTLANAAVALAQIVNKNLLVYGALAALAVYFSCVGLGTLCYRLVFNKR